MKATEKLPDRGYSPSPISVKGMAPCLAHPSFSYGFARAPGPNRDAAAEQSGGKGIHPF